MSERKRRGVWYTPLPLVEAIVAEAMFPEARSVLDPACGDGRFLRASGAAHVTGVDIDPATEFICDDALTRDWGDKRFDVVVGNPPFLNQLSRLTTRGGASRWGGGPYADAAAEFLALALHLTRPGGRIGLVLPQSLLSTRDAAAIRARVDAAARLRWMWWSDTPMFDARVRVWAGVWEVDSPGEPGRAAIRTRGLVRRAYGPTFEPRPAVAMPAQWSRLLAPDAVEVPVERGARRLLGDIARFSLDFRQHYYALADALVDDGDADDPPLVTSGLIDPGECLWGRRRARIAKRDWLTPRVRLAALDDRMRAWARTRLVPKILIANQTRTIEAVHDAHGRWLPGVPVITCVTDEPDRVMEVLASEAATRFVHAHAAGSGLGAGTVRLTPALLASIPLG